MVLFVALTLPAPRFRCFAPALALAALAVAGCPTSQTWTTARTVAPGRFVHAVGVDFVGVTIEDPHVAGGKSIDSTVAVGYPYLAYVLRYGVTAGLDAAVKLSATGTFALDGKVALLRGDVVSLALDPGVTAPFQLEYLYLNLPVLLSLEVGNDFTVTLYPKTSYVLVMTGEYTDTAIEGLLVGGGLHVQMRIVPGFAVTPAVEIQTLVWGEDRTSTVIDFGLGFSFGSLPEEARE